jgi:hypothetical protein
MRIASISAALLLAACGPAPQPPADKASPAPEPSISPSPSPEPARYIGRWAAEERLCKDGAWEFAAMDLSTAGEVSCDFHKVQEAPGGYDVDATCFAEGARTDETIKLRFAESAGAMLVESKTFRPIGLIRCGV